MCPWLGIVNIIVKVGYIIRIMLLDEVVESSEGQGQSSLFVHINLWRVSEYVETPFQNTKNLLNDVVS